MTDGGGVDIGANAARLLGRAVEDPTVLRSMRATEIEPIDLRDGGLQAGYALLHHLDQLGRLTYPHVDTPAARTNAAIANLRAISDWTIDRRRDRERVRHACFDQGRPLRYHDDVPSSTDLLLDAAARLNIVWWFNLWERGWPTTPAIASDVEAVKEECAYQRLAALGIRLVQRANARTAEPLEIAHDILARLDRIDSTAISRFLTRPDNRSRLQAAGHALHEYAPARTAVR